MTRFLIKVDYILDHNRFGHVLNTFYKHSYSSTIIIYTKEYGRTGYDLTAYNIFTGRSNHLCIK